MRDLNDLSFFAAVVGAGGFSAASRAIGVPKSRISRRVAALEAELGVQLIERSTRRFKVTDIGQEVYRHAKAALGEAEAIGQVVAQATGEPQGLVRVSCPLDADRLLGASLPGLLLRHPRLRVQVLVTNRRVDLVEENVDVAIRVRSRLDSDPDLQVRTVSRSGSILVASPELLKRVGAPAAPADLPRLPTLAHTDRPGQERWTLVNAAGEEAVVAHEPRLSATGFPILREAVLQGIGVGMLPEWSCREFLADGRMVRVLPDWAAPLGILHLAFTKGRGALPGPRSVIEFLAEVFHPRSAAWDNAL